MWVFQIKRNWATASLWSVFLGAAVLCLFYQRSRTSSEGPAKHLPRAWRCELELELVLPALLVLPVPRCPIDCCVNMGRRVLVPYSGGVVVLIKRRLFLLSERTYSA